MATLKDIEYWYSKVLDIPEQKRLSYLEENLSDSPVLLEEVRTLVLSEKSGPSLLTQLRDQLSGDQDSLTNNELPIINKYELIEEIGRGGMSVVYRANRTDGVFEQQVAVKVLKRGMDTDEIISRFEQERNVLARLQHPSIGQIYDGGVTADGRPYFVMELINGKDVVSYCSEKNLTIEARLQLFVEVCKAVEFAHQNLVIHRDIKPSNILIKDSGEVKLMDFGIAKLVGQDDESDQTLGSQKIFTPKFASPEQIRNEVLDIRSDVYQLGLVLETLLSSIRLTIDLKSILSRAKNEEKENRYRNIQEFFSDIQNYLEHRPVIARRSSRILIIKKLIRRNRVAFTFSSLLLLTIIFSTIYSYKQAQIAKKQAERSERISEYLIDIFESGSPEMSLGSVITAEDLVQRGIENIQELEGQSSLQSMLIGVLAEVNLKLGNVDKAKQLLKSGQFNLTEKDSYYISDYVRVLRTKAQILRIEGDYDSSAYFLDIVLNIHRKKNNTLEEARDLMALADVLIRQNKFDAAIDAAYSSMNIHEKVFGKGDVKNTEAMSVLGYCLHESGQNEKGKQLIVESIDILENKYGSVHPELGVKYALLSKLELSVSNYTEAIKSIKKSNKIYNRLYDEDYHELVINYNILGSLYTYIHNYDSANLYLEKSLSLSEKIFDENDRYNSGTLNMLARIAYNQGDIKKSKELLLKAYTEVKNRFTGPHDYKITSLSNLSIFYSGIGQVDSSKLFMTNAIDLATDLYGQNSDRRAYLLQTAAYNNITWGDRNKASLLLEEAINIYDSLYTSITSEIIRCRLDYATNFAEMNKKTQALKLIKELKNEYLNQSSIDSLNLADINSMLSKVLFQNDQLKEAKNLLLENISLLESVENSERMLNFNKKLLLEIEETITNN